MSIGGKGSRRRFTDRLLALAGSGVLGTGLDLGEAIFALPPATTVVASDLFAKADATGIGSRVTAAAIRTYILGIVAAVATIPEPTVFSSLGNTLKLGDAGVVAGTNPILQLSGTFTGSGRDAIVIAPTVDGAGAPRAISSFIQFNLSANTQTVQGIVSGTNIVKGAFTGATWSAFATYNPTVSGAGTIATAIGYHVLDAITVGTTNWGIYVAANNSFLGGAVTVAGGSASPALHVTTTGAVNSRWAYDASHHIQVSVSNLTSSFTLTGGGGLLNFLEAGAPRYVQLDPSAGNAYLVGETGGWAQGWYFKGSLGTARGGFGVLGDTDTISYYFIGSAFDNLNALYIYPNGQVAFGTGAGLNSDVNIGGRNGSTSAMLNFYSSGGAADVKHLRLRNDGGSFFLEKINDAYSISTAIVTLTLSSLLATFGGALTTTGVLTVNAGATTNAAVITTTGAIQQSLRYDASNRLDLSVSSAGAVTFTAVGASKIYKFAEAAVSISHATAPTLTFDVAGAVDFDIAQTSALTQFRTSGAGGEQRFRIDGATALSIFKTHLVAAVEVRLPASGTTTASLLFASGAAPSSPADGHMWYDGTDVKFRVGSTTKTFTLT